MTLYHLIAVASVFLAAISQMLLKRGASIPHKSIIGDYLNVWVIGGYALMGISLLVNIFAMNHGVPAKEISVIESLSYLFVPLLSLLCFKETISWKKWLSIAVIMIGIFVFFA